MTKIINFLKHQNVTGFSMYSIGEVAGFPDEFADQMIARGVAEVVGDGRPRNVDGSPVISKSGLTRAKELLGARSWIR